MASTDKFCLNPLISATRIFTQNLYITSDGEEYIKVAKGIHCGSIYSHIHDGGPTFLNYTTDSDVCTVKYDGIYDITYHFSVINFEGPNGTTVYPYVRKNDSGQFYTGMELSPDHWTNSITVNQVLKITSGDEIQFAFRVTSECYFLNGAEGIISMKLLSRL